MQKELEKAKAQLRRGATRAFISRVAWLDLEEKIAKVLHEAKAQGTDELGGIYLIDQSRVCKALRWECADSSLNTIWISVGWRVLNVFYQNELGEKQILGEKGGTLWFSQDPSGGVVALMSPYSSDKMKMDEADIIVGRYTCATKISEGSVRRHFKFFFRYLAVTSSHGNLGLGGYLFRLRMKMADVRHRSKWASNAHRVFVPVLIGLLGCLVSLYAAGRLSLPF